MAWESSVIANRIPPVQDAWSAKKKRRLPGGCNAGAWITFCIVFCFFFFFGPLGAGERLLIQSRLQAKRERERAVHGQGRAEPRVADEALLLSLLGHSTQLDN